MANSSPAILPISDPKSSSAAAASSSTDALQSNSAVRLFFSGISETVSAGLANRRPWTELIDRTAFSKPESVSEATLRIRKNYQYFRINYLTVVAAVLAVSLLTNPFSLIILAGLFAGWISLYFFRQSSDSPLTVFGRQFSERETLLLLIISTVAVIFLTSVGSVIVSALMVGVALVCLHAAFRAPEDLFLDEQESNASVPGFLSYFVGANSVNTTPPTVSARV